MELQPITPDSLDDEALTDLIEIRKSGVDHHASEGNKVQHAIQSLTLIALVELQQRRDADSSDPIYQWRERYEEGSLWDDCTKAQYDGFAKKTDCEVRILYTAPPAPVVNDELYKLANHVASSKNGLPEEWQDWAEELESEIRRAAMLQAGTPSVIGIDLASEPDRSVEVRYLAPPGYVMVPVEPTIEMLDEFDSIIDYGAEDSKDAWSRLIAAAPQQEVKSALEHGMQRYAGAMQKLSEGDK